MFRIAYVAGFSADIFHIEHRNLKQMYTLQNFLLARFRDFLFRSFLVSCEIKIFISYTGELN